jgi:thiamine-monophosphate kinase
MPPRPSRKSLADTGEDQIVALVTRNLPQTSRTHTGPGDDCAVLGSPNDPSLTLFKTDCLVAGIHFTMDTDPARVGAKLLNRAVSDIAAMGGLPQEALITLALPPDLPLTWLTALYRGLTKAAKRSGTGIAGGETSGLPHGNSPVLSVALLGSVEPHCLALRSGGSPGDTLVVTGRLGGSIAGHHLDFLPRLTEARWLVSHFRPSAMMDLSDGLARDLPRLAQASHCSFQIDPERLPRHRGCSPQQALADGEDYELLFAIPARLWPDLARAWKSQFPRILLTAIGQLTHPGSPPTPLHGGWEHFSPTH